MPTFSRDVLRRVPLLVVFVLGASCGHQHVKIEAPTVPPYADCSGESPVDPCVTPQP